MVLLSTARNGYCYVSKAVDFLMQWCESEGRNKLKIGGGLYQGARCEVSLKGMLGGLLGRQASMENLLNVLLISC